jgi:hypothetical protein
VAKKKKAEKPKEYTRRQLSHFKKTKRRQRIVNIVGLTVIAAIILIILGGWFSAEFYPLHRTVLKVNGVKFNVAYYIDVMKILRNNDNTKDAGTLSNDALQSIMQGEVMRQGAEKAGISVSDEEIKNYLNILNIPDNKNFRSYYGYQLLVNKLQTSYFGSKVPVEDKQVHALIMMLESDQQALEIRNRLVNGDNFTALAGQFGQDYYSKNKNSGDFGWHPRDVLKDQLSSAIPLDYAFSAEVGILSPPLSDNETYKQLGYWLIRLVDRPEEGKVHVQALVVSDNVTAMDVKARLEAGTLNLADAVDEYTEYSLSKEKGGDFGVIDISENSTYTQVFNEYVFNPDTATGKWSEPILETELWTRGGSWLVQVVEKDDNRKVSDEDRSYLIEQLLNDWFSELSSDPDLKIESNLLSNEMLQWVIDRFEKEYPAAQGLLP